MGALKITGIVLLVIVLSAAVGAGAVYIFLVQHGSVMTYILYTGING